jgi:hypothetical protein
MMTTPARISHELIFQSINAVNNKIIAAIVVKISSFFIDLVLFYN